MIAIGLFVNGEQVSSIAGSYPTLNDTFGNWLKAEKHVLGSFFAANIATRFLNGYWAEFILIDGVWTRRNLLWRI